MFVDGRVVFTRRVVGEHAVPEHQTRESLVALLRVNFGQFRASTNFNQIPRIFIFTTLHGFVWTWGILESVVAGRHDVEGPEPKGLHVAVSLR